MLKVVTECRAGCTFTWHSQQTLSAAHAGGVPEGNFALVGACLLSESTYAVLSRICSTIGLPLMCESTYYQYLSKYTMPCIFDAYNLMQTYMIGKLKERESMILHGDMRCDSPGFNAKYDTYSFRCCCWLCCESGGHRSVTVIKCLKDNFPFIKTQHNLWHITKSIKKKLKVLPRPSN